MHALTFVDPKVSKTQKLKKLKAQKEREKLNQYDEDVDFDDWTPPAGT